ncbi:MAG: hypothetical protein PHE18_07405 [Candidatus Omnitrophica bacterium]|nr:hypothetical protein [Candidatus Omnitrophota bacterium]MDD5553679.1 hypothetical protein [Candidatus Omnitrophota bacterium]
MNGRKILLVMLALTLCASVAFAQTGGATGNTGGGTTGTTGGMTEGTTGTMGTTGTTGAGNQTMGAGTGTTSELDAMRTAGFGQRDRLISMLESRRRTATGDDRSTLDAQIRRLRDANADNWDSTRDAVLNEINRE